MNNRHEEEIDPRKHLGENELWQIFYDMDTKDGYIVDIEYHFIIKLPFLPPLQSLTADVQ